MRSHPRCGDDLRAGPRVRGGGRAELVGGALQLPQAGLRHSSLLCAPGPFTASLNVRFLIFEVVTVTAPVLVSLGCPNKML